MPKGAPTGAAGNPTTQQHPDGCYYINLVTQSIQRQCNPLNAIALAPLGYFGKGWTPAAAFNAFPTFQDAKNAIEQFRNLPGADPLNPGKALGGGGSGNGGGGGSGDSGQSDWTHLGIRVAEFTIGAILIIIGINAVIAKTKGVKYVEQIAIQRGGMGVKGAL